MRVIATGAFTCAARSVRRALPAAVVTATLLGTGGAFRGVGSQEVQPPNRGGFTVSMGRPATWRWYGGVSAAVHRRDVAQAAFYAHGGFYRDVLNPVTASLGVIAEGYFGARGAFTRVVNATDGGVRVGLLSPTVRLGFGWEYSIRDGETDFFASLVHPLRRGGIFTGGGALRVDYLPGRNHSFGVGIRLPIAQRFVGRTRPRHDKVQLGDPAPPEIAVLPSSELVQAVTMARDHAHWLNRLTVPFTDHWHPNYDRALEFFVLEMEAIRAHLAAGGHDAHAPIGFGTAPPAPAGRTDAGDVPVPEAEAEAYHHQLERAFSIATSPLPLEPGEVTELGIETAAAAREIVLEQVILPYNRLLGQKKDEDSTRGLGTSASAAFYEWLTRSRVPRGRLLATTWSFAQFLELVEGVRAENRRVWEDSRLVWLPFQLVLRPEQHDSQDELNALVERATRETFTRANRHWYIENEQFQAELTRMILEAEDYHVLWIHDFRGYDAQGDPDEMAFRQVVHAYLPALISAVEAYDVRGKMPQYFIFHDQLYYEANGGHLWLDLLQEPLRHKVDLPDEFRAWEDSITGLQRALSRAIADSELLQAQARHFENGWIENLVKVHVSITNPPDASFWTQDVFPGFMGLPDLVMRDHRKVAFYDATEADPYKGMAIYTGMGVGEHYIGAGWEDRAMMIQGPVLLSLKDAARTLLENQGFEDEQIPWELRPKARAPDYDRIVQDSLAALGTWGADMQLHNQIGFRPKPVSVAKATLYTLMPPGAVIKAPDSIWGSHFWGSMLLGNALRGGRSLIMAPALANAPSAGFPQMSRAQDVMARLVIAADILEAEIEGAGGLLKVGLYDTDLAAGDIPRKILAAQATLRTTPWLRDLYGFHPTVIAGLEELANEMVRSGFDRRYAIEQEPTRAKLHLKANFLATREAWDKLLARPDVVESFRSYFGEIARQNQTLAEGGYREYGFLLEDLLPTTHAILEDYVTSLSPEERDRIALFFLLGSHNQNNRSMMLDGEVALVVASWSALFGFTDFLVIAGLSEWVDSVEELERLLPRYEGLRRRISHWIRIAV